MKHKLTSPEPAMLLSRLVLEADFLSLLLRPQPQPTPEMERRERERQQDKQFQPSNDCPAD